VYLTISAQVTNLLQFLCHVVLPKFAKHILSVPDFHTVSFSLECHTLYFGKEPSRMMLTSSPPQTLSFAEPRGKEVLISKMLVSAGRDDRGK
jgi:hypothetical protein